MKRGKVLHRLLCAMLVVVMLAAYAVPSYAADEPKIEFEQVDNQGLFDGTGVNAEAVPEKTQSQYADDDKVRVFIVLDEASALDAGYSTMNFALNDEAMAYSDTLEAQQETVIEMISDEVLDGEELEVNYQLSLITNAVSATVEYGQIEKIEAVDGVKAVYLEPVYELAETAAPDTITAGEMVGSYQTWTNGYTGAGTRIAIIDTGLDTDHPSFDAQAYLASLEEAAAAAGKTAADYDLLTAADIEAVLEELNVYERYYELTAEDLYYSEKVPFGFNYIDYDLNITHDYDSMGDHGTHVAGIAAANKYVPTAQEDGTVTYAPQAEGVVGIAPDAQLLVMKVFGAWGGAFSGDYMAAIEDALLLGADSVNLSLGSTNPGFTNDKYEGYSFVDEVFTKLVGSDTIVSISAGNDGAWGEYSELGANTVWDVSLDTVGSPGSYANALTVASVNNSGYTGMAVEFENNNLIYYNEVINGSNGTYSNQPMTTLDTNGDGTEYEYVLIEAIGEEADYEGIDVEGKVVLVYRGTTSFYQKHEVAEAMGAKALFVINNTEGVINMDLSSSTATIPCVSLLQTEGDAIIAGAQQHSVNDTVYYTGTVTVNSRPSTNYNHADGWKISDFSSWGVPGDLSLKPEITAPGGNIYSTLMDGAYGLMSGTSMAAPSVAGMSALVMQYIEENGLVEKTGLSARTLAQSLLMSTAETLMEGDMEYSPRRQGAGLANVGAATTTPSYILVGDAEGNDGKVKVELGDDPDRTGVYSFDFTIYNMSDETQSYAFDSSVLTEAVVDEVFIAESAYKLSPAVKYTVDQLESVLVYDFDQDGDVDVADADAMLAWINRSAAPKLSDAKLAAFDFDSDGDYDTNDVHLYLCYIAGTKDDVDVKATELTIAAGESATVAVTITLSDADRAYLDNYFTNGIYIDAFVYVDSAVDMSIPMLAFYGNWSDPSMFENVDFMAQEGYSYTYMYGYTNYLGFISAGDTEERFFMPNMYATDDQYIADRNAMSSLTGDMMASFNYTAIRNLAETWVEIVDAEDGTVYFSTGEPFASYSAFYYTNGGYWDATLSWADLFWTGTDAEGNPLPDETRTIVRLTGIPEYYVGTDKEQGNGVSIEIPVAIDNTAPEATKIAAVVEDNDITGIEMTVADNRYVAAIYLYNSDGDILGTYAVNQNEYAAETTVAMDVSEIEKDVIYASVIDYAGNATSYRVKISFQPDTEIASGIDISAESSRVLKGLTYQLSAEVYPEDLLTVEGVTWSTSDESIATVDENGLVTGVGVGNATITATTIAEPHLTASCEVEVFQLPGTDLRGFWADDWNGDFFTSTAYWTEFNTNDLTGIQKTSELLDGEFFAATVVGDKVVAGTRTHQGRTGYSDIYVFDPSNDYAAELKYEKVRWLTDMTYLPSVYGGKVAGSYAYNLNLLDMDTGVVVSLNLRDYLAGDYMIGVAYAYTEKDEETGVDIDYFYAITWTGKLYLIGLGNSPEDDGSELNYTLYAPQLITSIPWDAASVWYFNSLYYDKDTGYLYWASLENNGFWSTEVGVTMYAIEAATGTYYNIGSFPNEVLAVSGLFKESDLSAGVNTEAVDIELTAKTQTITAMTEAEMAALPELPELAD